MIGAYITTEDMLDVAEAVKRDFPEFSLETDSELRLFSDLIPKLESGEKRLTIRFKPEHVRVPLCDSAPRNLLPVYETYRDGDGKNLVGGIYVPKIIVAHARDFPEELARLDGFKDLDDMMQGMSKIYHPIHGRDLNKDDPLSCYYLENFKRN